MGIKAVTDNAETYAICYREHLLLMLLLDKYQIHNIQAVRL